MAKESIPLQTLLRALVLLTCPALGVLWFLWMSNLIAMKHFILAYLFILTGSGFLVLPFLRNLMALSHYVRDLSEDKKTQAPHLNFLNITSDLSTALAQLHRNFQQKKQQMESVITEREILVDTLPDMLIMTNDNQQIVRTNRASRLMFGQNLAGKSLTRIIESDVLLNAVSAVIEDLKGREVDFHLEEPEPRDFKAIIERFPIASKGGISVIITLNDITQLKRIEKMRADFVANASHEIRTPLTSITGIIETLRGPAREDVEVHDKFLTMMAEQAERMKNLITDLLSLSKLEMNANSVPTGKVDAVRIILKEKDHFEWAAKSKNMALRLDFNDNLPPVRGEESELQQVVHNLVGNAIKYGFADSEVTITARVTSDLPRDPSFIKHTRALVVSVKDQGEGIAREHIPRLTERFYRVDSARTRKVGGTGLGLAIVKHILQRHRGVLQVDSEVGKGSTFSVFLPLYEDAA